MDFHQIDRGGTGFDNNGASSLPNLELQKSANIGRYGYRRTLSSQSGHMGTSCRPPQGRGPQTSACASHKKTFKIGHLNKRQGGHRGSQLLPINSNHRRNVNINFGMAGASYRIDDVQADSTLESEDEKSGGDGIASLLPSKLREEVCLPNCVSNIVS